MMKLQRIVLIGLPFLFSSCESPSSQFTEPFKRFSGMVEISSFERLNSASVEISYKVRNTLSESICLLQFEGTNGVEIYRASDNTRILTTRDQLQENHTGEFGKAIPVTELKSGETFSRAGILFKLSELYPRHVSGENLFYAQVVQVVYICDALDVKEGVPGNFRYIESTDTKDGNSFLMVSDPTANFNLSY